MEPKEVKRAYLAGPMTGYEEFNFPAFFRWQKWLEDSGYVVFNPAQNDLDNYGNDFLRHPSRFRPRLTMKQDLDWICEEANCIALMPGWENSKGCAIEKALADYLGLEVIYLNDD